MNNFKNMWNQVECNGSKLQISVEESRNSIFGKLETEEIRKKKFIPVQIIFVTLFSFIFGYIVYQNTPNPGISIIFGIVLVTLASIIISVFPHVVKFPFKQFEHDKSSLEFLEIIKKKLDQSRVMLIAGIALQIAFLSIGLYLIIFQNSSDINPGYVYAFWGMMLGLGGAAIGGAFAFYHKHYKNIYFTISHFLDEK